MSSKNKNGQKAKSLYALYFSIALLIILFFVTVILLVLGGGNFDPGDNVFSLAPAKSGFRVGDDDGVWQNYTQIAIFRTYYENDRQVIIAQSSTGDNIIAPGTSNEYSFYIQNTSNKSLAFKLSMVAVITVTNFDGVVSEIPVNVKLGRYDDVYLVGGEDEWVPLKTLDGEVDEGTLGSKSYAYYTLYWQWEFESGNDFWDTYLASGGEDSSIQLTLSIGASAGGSLAPGAGAPIGEKTATVWPWIVIIMILNVQVIAILIFFGLYIKKTNEES